MRITHVDTVVVNAEMRNWIFVKVMTDEGITGWGEATLAWKTRAVVGAIADLEPFIVGQDPCRIEHVFQVMYRQPFNRPGIVGMAAISGIEMACWDIFGKLLGKPVHELLCGRVRDRVRLYDHLGGGVMDKVYSSRTAAEFTELAQESVQNGYDAIKVLIVPRSEPLEHLATIRATENVMAALRNGVGDGVDIMIDFHGRTTPATAIEYARMLEPYSPYFIEEPCPPENVAGIAHVARATPIPVATGERLVTRFGFRELFEQGACAVAQPDVCHCGGIWELRKIAAMAEVYFAAVAPHNPLGPLATAAAVHVDLVTPNFLIQEAVRADVPWRDDVVSGALTIENGSVLPPTSPGLGIEIDERQAAKHPFEQERLWRYYHPDGAVADW